MVSPKKCTSENKKGMRHCEYLNEENTWKSEIWRSVCENFNMLKLILRRFEQNLAERNMRENKIHQDILDCDPKVSVPCV